MIGAGGILLAGGAELAAGVVLGAALDAVIRRQGPRDEAVASAPPQEQLPEEHPPQERPVALMDRVPRAVRDRARAVYDAARGKQPSTVQ